MESKSKSKNLPKPYTCDLCGKGYNSTGSLNKHKKTKHSVGNDLVILDNDANIFNDPETERLKGELKKLVLSNPSYDLKKPVKTNEDMNLIDAMQKDELEARILDYKRQVSKKLDNKFSKGTLDLTAFLIGNMMDMVSELQNEFDKDILLQESVNDVLSAELLCHVDAKIKVLALGSMDCTNAYIKSMPRKKIASALKKAADDKKKLMDEIIAPEPQTAEERNEEAKEQKIEI